jgi:hypothetical protein
VVSTNPGDRTTDIDNGHIGYVAGRYRAGVWSDQWTEVSRCAERTFTAYAPACTCGWRGAAHPPTAHGQLACQRGWTFEHRTRVPMIGIGCRGTAGAGAGMGWWG